ncbi:hypothetical protein SAMN05216418_0405 [Microbacterium enclense]|uniref:Uncharacterized protein n=1 Tax=Microbacterium enclense TaxID=993073 RepID=A0A1G6GMC3_9MICO|nr:hypothetical protein SAMN05216418_0405 [Microbacterium enclense]
MCSHARGSGSPRHAPTRLRFITMAAFNTPDPLYRDYSSDRAPGVDPECCVRGSGSGQT